MVVYEKGSIYKCEVTSVESYGAFVKLENGYSGLIHISEISNSFIKNINNIFKKGDSIYVEVLETNDELKQLKLSVKNIKFKLSEKNKVKKSIEETPHGFSTLGTKLPIWLEEKLKKIENLKITLDK